MGKNDNKKDEVRRRTRGEVDVLTRRHGPPILEPSGNIPLERGADREREGRDDHEKRDCIFG